MDPQASLNELFAAVCEGDLDTAQDRLDALCEWHLKRGFLPDLKPALDAITDRNAGCFILKARG